MNESDVERLRSEAAELRALVRSLSSRLTAAVGALPLEAALSLARGGDASAEAPFRLDSWTETIEMTPADVSTEMELLWKRLPPREGA